MGEHISLGGILLKENGDLQVTVYNLNYTQLF